MDLYWSGIVDIRSTVCRCSNYGFPIIRDLHKAKMAAGDIGSNRKIAITFDIGGTIFVSTERYLDREG